MEEADTSQSLAALEYRLHRLEHYIAGSSDVGSMPCPTQDQSAHARIARLERGLNGLESRSSTIRQLLQLQTAYPELFRPSTHPISTLSIKEQLAIVNASAPAFQETASRLTTLRDLPIPTTTATTQLISLQPRIDNAQAEQARQGNEMRGLRGRSARAIEGWYELGVLGTGECWAEWESRLEEVEKQVRRRERGKEEVEKEGQAYRIS